MAQARAVFGFVVLAAMAPAHAQIAAADIDAATQRLERKVIDTRRDLHAHPELSNRETRTADIVARRLRALQLDVKTGIAITGVAAVLKGALPGPTIALRADMDALPVTEQTDVPFKSTMKAQFRGETVGVMHACGHDGHVAILLGVAEALANLRDRLHGQVLFIFQPAEEGPPEGETGGSQRMLKEGLFDIAKPEAVFGLHLIASLPTGVIGYRSGPMMASSDRFTITVTGRQTHGSRPWNGRSHRCRRADRHEPAIDRESPARHHRFACRHQRRRHQGRDSLQHHSGSRRDGRDDSHVQ